MWRSRGPESGTTVTCIACGEDVPRQRAREYDKEGDRWERHGKDFEYLCKACHRECCHQPRPNLEDTLTEAGAGECDRASFIRNYNDLVQQTRVEE